MEVRNIDFRFFIFVHRTPNYRLENQLGSGIEVEMASWDGDEVNVAFNERGKRNLENIVIPPAIQSFHKSIKQVFFDL